MIELILTAALFIVYMLGTVLAKEYVDAIEEATEDFLPRPFPYWTFILTWPWRVTQSLFLKETDDE